MSLFKKLLKGTPAASRSDFFTFSVTCSRCGEVIEGRVNLANDLSAEDEGGGFHARKVLMGSGHCFQRIEVELHFDPERRLIDKHIEGGTFTG